MASSADAIIQGLLAGTGFGRTSADFAQQNQQLSLGNQRLQLGQMQMAQAQQEAQRQQQYQAAAQDYFANPNPNKLAALATMFPEQAKALSEAWKIKDEAQKLSDTTWFSSIENAAKNGRKDLALSQLKNRRDAESRAGGDTSELDDVIRDLEAGEEGSLNYVRGYALAHLRAADPGNFDKNYGSKGEGPKVLGYGDALVNADGSVVYQAPDAPFTLNEGETRYANPSARGGDLASGSAGAGGNGQPRSVRNRNPGNIVDGSFAKSQPGYVGSDGRFAVFKDEASGRAAQGALLQSYIGRGFDTVGKIINRWAPRSDGNDTGAYVGFVSKQLGVSPSQKLTAADIPRLQAAIARFEGGPASASNGPTPASASGPQAIATAPRQPGTRILTPAEVAAIPGLDPQTVYQQSKEGTITAVGRQNKSQLKPWPVNALDARTTNNAALKNIGGTISLLDPRIDPKDNSKQAREARKNAVIANRAIGFGTGALGDRFTQWNNPEGTDARARIGQIGGLIIKDTSGAAVSLSEDQRLAKWVPLVTDSPKVALAKLRNLERELKQRNQAMDDTYSEDQGYRPFKAKGGAQPAPSTGFRILRVRPK